MTTYLLGLATLPVAFALFLAARSTHHLVTDWWVNTTRPAWRSKPYSAQRRSAAVGVLTSRRLFVLRLPGGRAMAYRSRTGRVPLDDQRTNAAYDMVHAWLPDGADR